MQFQQQRFDTFDMVQINEMGELVTFILHISYIVELLDEARMQRLQLESEIEAVYWC